MKDIDIIIEIDGHIINVNTDMIEEDVIRQRMGLEPKSYDWTKNYKKEMKAIRLISGRFHKI